jgi:hypothetical protein
MHRITAHSAQRATDEAVRLWALASTQFPARHGLILDATAAAIIDVISSFALNARRAMETIDGREKYELTQPRWKWESKSGDEVVRELRDALNRIIHAQQLDVRFVELPASVSVIDGGAVVVPFLHARTDRKSTACIDPFALAHVYLYKVLPKLAAMAPTAGDPPAVH